ncbi:MAG TPA: Calx-beta domain-containing protein, partial [Thermosynechococcaceae cyanobacterium]
DGGGAPGLIVSGSNASRVLFVDANVDFQTIATVRNLTLSNGSVNDGNGGGAIFVANKGALTVDNVTFNANASVNNGGAISTAFDTNLTVLNSRFNSNAATVGNSEQGAGAIFFFGPGALTVQNSDFNNNKGINGGAINSLNGTISIENSRFVGNDVLAGQVAPAGTPNNTLRGYGGAIYTDRANNTTTIRNSYFENNASRAAGGALYLFNDSEDVVTIDGSSFKSNRALGLPGGEGGSGGAIYHLRNSSGSGSFSVTNASFVDNESRSAGGAIRLQNSPSAITNATFANNRIISVGQDFSANGGALVAFGSQVNLTNSTLSQNTAHWVGGGIAASSDSTVRVTNSIYDRNVSFIGGTTPAANEPAIGSGRIIDQGGNIQFGTIGDTPGSGVRVIDPLLGPLQQSGNLFFLPLLAGSPAIDTGVSGGSGVDGRGVPRDGLPDVGAVEFFSGTLPPVLPTLRISDVSLNEGNAGTTNAVFTVSLSSASASPISVNFATANGTAIAGSDYTPLSGILNFAPNQLTQTIQIPVIGDTVTEPNETFSVNLSAPVNAALLNSQGIATLVNDDGVTLPGTTPPGTTPPGTTPPGGGTTPPSKNPPGSGTSLPGTLSISDVQVAEGTTKGLTKAVFTVSLSQPVDRRVSVSYFTANGSAMSGSDYQRIGGRISFNPGQTTRTIEVNVRRDRAVELDETFSLNLRDSAGAFISKGQGIGTIVNDDSATGAITLPTAITSATNFIRSVLKGNLPAPTAGVANGSAGGFFTKGFESEPTALTIGAPTTHISELSKMALSKAAIAALRNK